MTESNHATADPWRIMPGETYNGRALAHEGETGRPSRRFLEAAATDLLVGMPDPRGAARLAAALAEAHEASTPTGGMAVREQRGGDWERRAVAVVGLENAAESTHVTVQLLQHHLEPEAALEFAAALIHHAGAARAVRDLHRGHPSVSVVVDDRGPPYEPIAKD